MGFEHFHPTRIIFGRGVIERIPDIPNLMDRPRVLLVTGRSAMRRHGCTEKILQLIGADRVVLFEEVEPNPTVDTVERGAELCRREGCTLVVGAGGGSALDAAKAIAALSHSPGRVWDYLRSDRELHQPGIPFVAIPTTSGSGSEVTPYAILTVPEDKLKSSLRHPILYPRVAVVDPDLSTSLPPRQTAAAGLDVLCHAVESIWSIRSQPIAGVWAEAAVELVFRHLLSAFCEGDNIDAREGMSLASLLAGLAISQTGTTAIHAASYPITFDVHLEHGFACALFLPPFLQYNRDAVEHRFTRLMRVLRCADWGQFEEKIVSMMRSLGAPFRLTELGLSEEVIPDLAKRGIGKSSLLNPVDIGVGELEKTLRDLR